MSVTTLGRQSTPARFSRLLHARRRQLLRIHPDPLMGSMLSEWIKKRKSKGIDLSAKIGKGSISYSLPGSSPQGSGPVADAGPLAFVKKNPLIIAGVAGGGLLLTMFILSRRKGGKK